jgi:hypothetical protein
MRRSADVTGRSVHLAMSVPAPSRSGFVVRLRIVIAMAALLGVLAGCTGPSTSPGVPSLPGSSGTVDGAMAAGGDGRALNGATGDASAARRAALHEAAECIRRHGAPDYPDPVLTSDGLVYTDARRLHDAVDETELAAIENTCGELIRAARFDPDDQAPPPPRLIQAGVKSAECLRTHGFPNYPDPTAESEFTPGKGFGLDPESLPAAGKQDPTVLRALQECRSVLDAEARLSSLGSLADA